jgi:hypothetical protein
MTIMPTGKHMGVVCWQAKRSIKPQESTEKQRSKTK